MHTRKYPVLLALALSLAAAAGSGSFAQTRPQATFRASVDFVEVDVVVTDAAGRFVTGLTAADFELMDAGKPHRIETFREVNIPVERTDRVLDSGAMVPSDVATNERTEEGRIFVLVLDDYHTKRTGTLHVRQRAREFVERYVGSNDLVAVVQTSGSRTAAQDFTSNRALVLEAIDRFQGVGLDSRVLTQLQDMQSRAGTAQADRPARDAYERERLMRARGTFSAIEALAAHLAGVTGRRKAMVLFSGGIDVDGAGGGTDVQQARREMLDAVAAATRANVHIYAVDASGLEPGTVGPDLASFNVDGQSIAGLDSEALASERRRQLGTLRVLAAETGGAAIVGMNAFADAFARILRENSTYYLLGYSPQAARDGKFHNLEVRVKRPGLRVTARAGYHAAKTGPRNTTRAAVPMSDLMEAPLPSSGLPMRVAAASFKSTRDTALVLIAIDLPRDAFRFQPAGDVFAEDLHVVFQAIAADGKVAASDGHELNMRVRPATRDVIAERGFRMIVPVELKPGRYRLRVAGDARNAERRGSVFADVIVPDFFDAPLVWSGIAINSAAAAAVPTRAAGDDIAKAIPLMPSAVRSFASSDTLALYAEAYVSGREEQMIDLTTAIRDASGKVMFSRTDQRSTSEIAGGAPGARPGGFGLRVDIPLKGLPPGAYVLSVSGRSRASGHVTASREIPFEIS